MQEESINKQEVDDAEVEKAAEQEPQQTCGSLLAIARKEQNKTVEEIAGELNLSVTQIKTIELDQTDGLPEPTYVRGYIRAYAKLLGLDSEKVLEHYRNPNWQEESRVDEFSAPKTQYEVKKRNSNFDSTKIIASIVIIASLFFLFYSGMIANPFSAPEDIVGNDAVNISANDESESDLTYYDSDTTSSDITSNDVVDNDNETANVSVSTNETSQNNESLIIESVKKNLIEISFTKTSWIDIRDKDDNRLAYRSYQIGEVLSVDSDGPLHIFIGNADGVTVMYNKKTFDLGEYREGVYAKFSVGL